MPGQVRILLDLTSFLLFAYSDLKLELKGG